MVAGEAAVFVANRGSCPLLLIRLPKSRVWWGFPDAPQAPSAMARCSPTGLLCGEWTLTHPVPQHTIRAATRHFGGEMRAIGLLLLTAMLMAGCSDLHQPPTSADTQFSVVVYNRMNVPVFALFHQVGACASATMSAQDIIPVGGDAHGCARRGVPARVAEDHHASRLHGHGQRGRHRRRGLVGDAGRPLLVGAAGLRRRGVGPRQGEVALGFLGRRDGVLARCWPAAARRARCARWAFAFWARRCASRASTSRTAS